jgi:eukaryotic-like serine/threonine-protein kinase
MSSRETVNTSMSLATAPRLMRHSVKSSRVRCSSCWPPRETANGFANDIQRHLNDEPVVACPPSAVYRFRKFARRNKALLTTATLVVTALFLGVVVSLWFAIQAIDARIAAEDAKNHAQKETRKANATSDLLQKLLFLANTDSGKRRDYTVRELLDVVSAGLARQSADQLADEPEVEAAIQFAVGRAYHGISMPDEAVPHLKVALDLRRRVFGDEHEKVAECLMVYAHCLENQNDYAAAEPYARWALRIYRRSPNQVDLLLVSYNCLQRFLIGQQRYVEAEAVAHEGLKAATEAGIAKHVTVALILLNSAKSKLGLGNVAEARTLGAKGMALMREMVGDRDIQMGWTLLEFGDAHQSLGEYGAAGKYYREALAVFLRYHDASYATVQRTLRGLDSCLRAQGDPEKLKKFHAEFDDMLRQIEPPSEKSDP